MLGSSQVRFKAQSALKPLAEVIDSLGVPPNVVTVAGFVFSALAGLLLAVGIVQGGAVLVALSGLCDLMDGILARLSGRESRFGAFLDSLLDRYADFFPLFGLAVYGSSTGDMFMVVFSLLSVAGAFSTSYARARADSLGADCRSGIAERPERFIILLAGLFTGFVDESLCVLAVVSNVTAFQRLLCAAEKLKR